MESLSVKNLCIYHTLDALTEGLSHFSGSSRTALLYAEKREDPMRVYDPQDLLAGHEPKLKELYLDSDLWRSRIPFFENNQLFGQILPERKLPLTGLITYGGKSRSIFYQMWFAEQHPDMCSTGPTERWLEHAACLLAHDFAHEEAFYTGSARYVLREYSTHAVRDFIWDELNRRFGWDIWMEVYTILDSILAISKTPEEGAWPRGTLVFVEPSALKKLDFMVRFPVVERLGLRNYKHVRKLLLAVEDSDRKLISDGQQVVGIMTGELPMCRITADFRGGHGFLRLMGEPVCSFFDGRYHSTNRKPKLVQLEELLLESPADQSTSHILFKTVAAIVEKAGERKHGCTVVIDFNDPPLSIAGQKLEQPIDLQQEASLELAKSLAKVDGALHLGGDLRLHSFACLLDGRAVPGEDRSRGARYNSALRFTAERKNLIVVVVSSDRPVSVIQGGVEITASSEWAPFAQLMTRPPTLEEWLARSCGASR